MLGVMSSVGCGCTTINHQAQAVGITLSSGNGYWKIRNSWGLNFGENGFLRIEYGANACGLASQPGLYTVSSVGVPTKSPSYVSPLTTFCSPYSASKTNSATTGNSAMCQFTACGGISITISSCSPEGGTCTTDTYLRLRDSKGIELASNDDYCGVCSFISYSTPSTSACGTIYTIVEGCYSSKSCSATVAVVNGAVFNNPTLSPSPFTFGSPSPSVVPR